MSRLSLLIDFLAYEGQKTNDPQDADKIKNSLELSDVDEIHRLKETIADTTVDRSIALPDSTTDLLLLFTDREISIKINGGQAETYKPKSNGCKTAVLLMKGDLTSLEISNSSGADAKLDIIMVNE